MVQHKALIMEGRDALPHAVDEREMLSIYLQKRKQLQAEKLFGAYNVTNQKSRKLLHRSNENF